MAPLIINSNLTLTSLAVTLAFWPYSVVSHAKDAKTALSRRASSRALMPGDSPAAFLGGEEVEEVQKSISLGWGQPSLRGPCQESARVADACLAKCLTMLIRR